MIPKEMAQDLYNKFYNTNNHPNSVDVRHNAAKENSLICIRYVIDQSRQQVCNYFQSEYDLMDDHVYQHKVGKHSQKPDYFRQLISKAVKISFDEPKKLELFARSRAGFFPDIEYEGWDVFGNQVNNSIELPK